jgi:hypothetical protein
MEKIKINSNFKFTFDTDVDLRRAELTGYIESYDIVRICVKRLDNGNQVDFPIKTREDYFETVASLNERSNEYDMVEIYQDTHMFDMYSSGLDRMDNSHFKEIKVMLDYTFEEIKGKMIFLKLDEDGDTATEYFEVNTIEDYQELEQIVDEYSENGILDEYWIYQD